MPDDHDSGGQNKQSNEPLIRILDNTTYKELSAEKNQTKKLAKTKRTKNEWRSIFAFILLVGFLLIVGFIVLSDQLWGAKTNAKDLLTTVGTLISSPLSFVIGYYYKDNKNN